MARKATQQRQPHTKHKWCVVHPLFDKGASSSVCQDKTVKGLWQPLYHFLSWSLLSRQQIWLQLFPSQLLQSNQTLTSQSDRSLIWASLSSSRLPMVIRSPASQQRQILLHSSGTA